MTAVPTNLDRDSNTSVDKTWLGRLSRFASRLRPSTASGSIRRAMILWVLTLGAGSTLPSKPIQNLVVDNAFWLSQENSGATTANADENNHSAKQEEQAKQSGGPLVNDAKTEAAIKSANQQGEAMSLSTATTKGTTTTEKVQPPTRKLKGWQFAIVAVLAPLVVFVTWTPTNIAIICCASSVLGAAAHRLHLSSLRDGEDLANSRRRAAQASQRDRTQSAVDPALDSQNATSTGVPTFETTVNVPDSQAIVHGLGVFVGILVGVVVVQGSISFDQEGPGQYLRLAGAATLFSIAAGANPRFLRILTGAFTPFKQGEPAR